MSEADSTDDPPPKAKWRYEPKDRDYARTGKPRAVGPGPTRHVLRIARADRRLADPAPEVQPRNITARYQNAGAAGEPGHPAFLLHLNQAGKRIEALLVDLSHPAAPRYHRFGGDLKSDGTFRLNDDDGNGGSVKIDDGDLLLEYDAVPLSGERFRPREFAASFLDESLQPLIEIIGDAGVDAGTARKIVSDAERTPLTDAQMKFLSDGLAFDKINPYLTNYHQYSSGKNTTERARLLFAADDLDGYLGKVLPDQRWGQQMATAFEYARRTLAFEKATFDHSTKSVLQWIEDMTVEAIEVQPDINSERPLTNVRRLVGLKSGTGLQRFEYRLDLDLKHKGVTVWGKAKAEFFYGTMMVSSPTAPSFRGDGHTYNVALAGGGLLLNKGKGGEEDIKAHASFSTLGEWTPADFPGTVKLFEGGVWVGKKVFGKKVGGGKRDAALVLAGRGTHPEKIVALEGLGGDYREGVGGEFQVSVGRVFEKGEDLAGKDFSRPPKQIYYAVNKSDKGDVHFDLGSAILKNRVALRKCAAIWLPWLESPLSALEIVGQADTVEKYRPGRNQELSDMRAKNIKQALMDILGKDLAIPDRQIETKGLGDVEASKYDRAETPDRKFRRVDVTLNGRCVLVLWSS